MSNFLGIYRKRQHNAATHLSCKIAIWVLLIAILGCVDDNDKCGNMDLVKGDKKLNLPDYCTPRLNSEPTTSIADSATTAMDSDSNTDSNTDTNTGAGEKLSGVGQRETCVDNSECAIYPDATYCNLPFKSCFITQCDLVTNNCPDGFRCCDLSFLGDPLTTSICNADPTELIDGECYTP